MNLLRKIYSAVWMVDPGTLQAAAPFVSALLRGEDPKWPAPDRDTRPYALWQNYGGSARYYNYHDAPPGSVAVHPVIGTVVKYGGLCTMGTEDLMQQMAAADSHKNIVAHVIEMDSGGGEGTNIETVARFIKNELTKPVVTWFNGMSASAAYYMAAATDEIYASESTDMVGSIGALISFADWREFYEKQGIKLHEIYADPSDLKNQGILQAMNGEYDLLKSSLLNPFAERFIATVKEFRPQLQDEDAYRGRIFLAAEAEAIGMIDGILTFAQALDRAKELAEIAQQNSFNQNNIHMNYPRLESLIGSFEEHDGGVFLRSADLQLIERNLVTEGFEPVQTSTLQAVQEALTAMNDTLNAVQADVARNSAAIEAYGDLPGDVPTSTVTEQDTADDIDTDATANALALLAQAANSGDRVNTLQQ